MGEKDAHDSRDSLVDNPWVVILARTLRGATQTLQLAARLTPTERILVVTSHEGNTVFSARTPVPPANVCAQPRDRGTATGLLLAATHIEPHEPEAEVIVLHAGTETENEMTLLSAVGRARLALRLPEPATVLLGMIPDSDRFDPAWIGPAPPCDGAPTLRFRHPTPPPR